MQEEDYHLFGASQQNNNTSLAIKSDMLNIDLSDVHTNQYTFQVDSENSIQHSQSLNINIRDKNFRALNNQRQSKKLKQVIRNGGTDALNDVNLSTNLLQVP